LHQDEAEKKGKLRQHLKNSALGFLEFVVFKLFDKVTASNGNRTGQAGNGGK
jgi:hypothetical protein